MRLEARTIVTATLLLGCVTLTACGKKDEGTTTVQMNNLEVVDGTTTDAMTDLDGVQSESTALAVSGNRSDNAAAPAEAKNESAPQPAQDTEVLSDQ
ncbi:hypothetical protein [Sphingobium bisphenolivorans]|uniref:hypothetical protein n=1 Tax=Sphingobium bisphenolivorans TaxID=1335760 RepID=UPI0003A38612|nr:hypothetical protein [Sphingobium bisphenolivorans]